VSSNSLIHFSFATFLYSSLTETTNISGWATEWSMQIQNCALPVVGSNVWSEVNRGWCIMSETDNFCENSIYIKCYLHLVTCAFPVSSNSLIHFSFATFLYSSLQV
jgi:hypothetical protein